MLVWKGVHGNRNEMKRSVLGGEFKNMGKGN